MPKTRNKAYHREVEESKFIARLKKHLYYAWIPNTKEGSVQSPYHQKRVTWKDIIHHPFFRKLKKTRKIDTWKADQDWQKMENKRDRLKARSELKDPID